MADERIPGNSGFANQTGNNSNSRELDDDGRSATGLSRVQTFGGNRQHSTAIGGYAKSSSQQDDDSVGNSQMSNVQPSKASSHEKSEEAAKKTTAKQEDKQELAEDEYYERPLGVRILFWLLRKSIVPIIMAIMLLAGLYIGYTVLGDQPKEDVFHWSTWRHLYDLIFADS